MMRLEMRDMRTSGDGLSDGETTWDSETKFLCEYHTSDEQ